MFFTTVAPIENPTHPQPRLMSTEKSIAKRLLVSIRWFRLFSELYHESSSGGAMSQAIRCDNGPEYISHRLQAWAKKNGVRLDYIQPGKPQQNAYVERFNRTVRYDWLNQYFFESIQEVQDHATKWLWTYNNERPYFALGGIPPRARLAEVA